MSFEELNAIEVAVTTFGAYMICLNAWCWLRSFDFQALLHIAKGCVQYLRDVGGARRRETMDVLVSSRLQLRRETDVHGVCTLSTWLCSWAFVGIIRAHLTGTEALLSIAQQVALLLCFFFVTLFRARKHLLKGAGAYLFYCVVMAGLGVFGASAPNDASPIAFTWARISIIRIMFSVCCLNPGLVLLVNLFCSASIACTSILRPLDAENLALLFENECRYLLVMVFLSFYYHHHVVLGLRHELDVAAQKIEKSAVIDLLDAEFDVNLTLDESFRIADHSERFAALLMRPVSRSLQGIDIRDFVPNEQDKSRIRTQLSRLHPGDNLCASALSFSMRDSNRSDLRVEMLSVPFVSLDGSIHFLVGIREVVGTTRLAALPSSFEERPGLPDPVSAMRGESATPSGIAERSVHELHEYNPSEQVSVSWHGTPPALYGANLYDGILDSEHSFGSSSRILSNSSLVESDHASSNGQHSASGPLESVQAFGVNRDGTQVRLAL
eukprot:TRINITY_DN6018_c0_g2_i2.p1 TRINITY_DN6018_c0_g2~~TRINITY_DN6018_c0_g2_i2.p1  ORF type:complete len:518 (-),score=31.27 TRINITY_DN6018_c0_g2_i2:251-1741(-)